LYVARHASQGIIKLNCSGRRLCDAWTAIKANVIQCQSSTADLIQATCTRKMPPNKAVG